MKSKFVPFDIPIHADMSTGEVYIIRIDVPVRESDGMEIMTPQALDAVEATQFSHRLKKPCQLCDKIEDENQLHAVYRCNGAVSQLAEILKQNPIKP